MKKLLVVVDYQVDFCCTENGALGFEKAKELEDGIYNKVKLYLNNEYDVLFTCDTHDNNYLETREGKHLPIPHCVQNTHGHELYGKLNEFKNNIRCMSVDKFGFAPYQEDIEAVINYDCQEDIETVVNYEFIEIVGIVTNICVISTAIAFQTAYPNAEITIDAKCCASFDNELHEKALDVMEGLQMNVINREAK